MKITKEILEHLKVTSISLKKDSENLLCFLERVEKGVWTFSLPQKIDFPRGEKISFLVTFQEEEGSTLFARIHDSGEDWCEVLPEKQNDDKRLCAFLTMISEMEAKFESLGRRKEERIKIGKEKADVFGLSTLEQSVFTQGAKIIQPCVILDASIHGICVITPKTYAIQNEENFYIKVSFKNPEQTVILKAHRVYSRLNKTTRKSFLTLSCQLLEPIHFVWKERVISMIEKEP
ncbi:MAG: hypothetical protein IJR39_07110 [Treponema sp.]|nr:hypothetical protein [Treponema sp.]MBQ9623087.1 hypothetical protein [Treponema sp.]